MNIKNKTFLITGSANGIGRELAINLLKKGANIIATDIDKDALKKLEEELHNKNLKTYQLDISNKDDVEALIKDLNKNKEEIDGVINNAGIIQPFVKIASLNYDDIERVMNVNFYGTLYLTKAVLPQLLKRPEAQIVNISSMGGFLPVPGQGVYGASKAAVKLFTEALYAELRDSNINVMGVFPGATKTNIAKNSGVMIDSSEKKSNIPMTSAEEAAQTIVDAIEKNKFQVFIGKDSKFMNTLYRLSPEFATNLIAKKMKSLLEK